MKKSSKILGSLFLMLLMLFCLAAPAWAADDITVYVSVSIDGELQETTDGRLMAYLPVTVPAGSSMDDVFKATHEKYLGTADGYSKNESGDVNKFWGHEKEYFGYSSFPQDGTTTNKIITPSNIRQATKSYIQQNLLVAEGRYISVGNFIKGKQGLQLFSSGSMDMATLGYVVSEVTVKQNVDFSALLCLRGFVGKIDGSIMPAFQPNTAIYYCNIEQPETLLPLQDSDGNASVTTQKGLFKGCLTTPGDYILTTKNTPDTEGNPSQFVAPVMIVHVLPGEPNFNNINLVLGQDSENNLVQNFNSANKEYTIIVPECYTQIFGKIESADKFYSNVVWQAQNFNNGSWEKLTGNNIYDITAADYQKIALTAETQKLKINIRDMLLSFQNKLDNSLLSEYIFNIQRMSLLDGLTFDEAGSLDGDFDSETNSYTVYVNKDMPTLGITSVVENNLEGCIVKINGQTVNANTEYHLALANLTFDENRQCPITVTVLKDGEQYLENSYTLTLNATPHADEPEFVIQPQDAKYVQAEYAINQTVKELSVFAGANNQVTYQWYCIANDTEAVQIANATNATYTPDVSQKGDYWYYCVAANTPQVAEGAETKTYYTESAKALVKVYGDPRPKAEFITDIPLLSSYGQDIMNLLDSIYDDFNPVTGEITEGKCPYTNGFYYKSGDEVAPIKLRVYSDVPDEEAGEYMACWAENGFHKYTLEFLPPTDVAYGKRTYRIIGLTHEFLGQTYEADIYSSNTQYRVFVFVDESGSKTPDNVGLKGSGTEAEPWQIASLADIKYIQEEVLKGHSFEGKFFKMTADITLPKDFAGIGADPNGQDGYASKGVGMLPFSGNLDGDGHTITYEYGIKNPLFNYVRECTVKNLNIYAPYISNYVLLGNYVVDYGSDGSYSYGYGGSYEAGTPDTIDISNVTIKKGSNILKAGFLGGFASGANTVNLTNCTVEEDVNIGYDAEKQASAGLNNMGSFVGSYNGRLANCKSGATVYGNDSVGGIVGVKGQSMGVFRIVNCEFTGKIVASGEFVGGIAGQGYSAGSAPNTPCVSIMNCFVAADISGKDKVGGIFGGEGGSVQNWGSSFIRDNFFYGKVSATAENASVGAIVGYMNSLNKGNIIEKNYYLNSCGTNMPVGGAKYIDTHAEHGNEAGVIYVNTAAEIPDIYGFSKDVGDVSRDDDPLGKDKDKLAQAMTAEQFADGTVLKLLNSSETGSKNWMQGDKYPVFDGGKIIPLSMTISGEYKTEYYIGDELDLSGAVFTLNMSDGSTQTLAASEVAISGFDTNTRGEQTLTAEYNGLTVEFKVTVLKKPEPQDPNKPVVPGVDPNKIRVYFSLLGDSVHGAPASDKDTHTLKNKNLQTWIGRKAYEVDINATVKDVFEMALTEAGMTWRNPSGNYVEAITYNGMTLAEFSNGNSSGWMYTLNGEHPNLGLAEQFLENNDVIVWHYTDDYTIERGSENWGGGSSNKGNVAGGAAGGEAGVVLNPGTVEGADGKNLATMTVKEITKAIENAKEDSLKNIVIEPNVKGSAKNVSLSLPLDSLNDLAKEQMNLYMNSRQGSLNIPQAALKAIAAQAGGIDIRLNVENKETKREEVKTSAVNALAQAAANLRGAAENLFTNATVTEVTITSNNKAITSFDGHELTLYLPVADKDLFVENQNYKVVSISADGAVETLIGKCMKYNGQIVVQVKVNHLSTFIVTNETEKEVVEQAKPGEMNFADVTADKWFYEAVKFAYEAGLMNGEGTNTFNPNGNLNRAMLVTILYRLEESPAVSESSKFGDVAAGQWYTEAVIWASSNGIVNGYEDNTFKPMNNVSREEMAAMLMRYAEFKGIDVSATKDLSSYNDAAKVAGWAQQNMSWANSAGLIQGDENNNLNPQGKATRAEAAMILMRLVKNVL